MLYFFLISQQWPPEGLQKIVIEFLRFHSSVSVSARLNFSKEQKFLSSFFSSDGQKET
jgi:hypothetical protein